MSFNMIADNKEPFHVALVALYGTENSGIRYLSAYLKKHGVRVSVVFFREWRNNDNTLPDKRDMELFLGLIQKLNPGLVGFSFISSFLNAAESLTDKIKKETGIPVVWGGIHATAMTLECLDRADFVISGEGEEPLLELCRVLSENRPVFGIRNIGYVKNGEKIKEPLRPLMEELDLLPFPDYGHDGKYLLDRGRITPGDPVRTGAEYRIYCSRGCPYSCTYCYNSILRREYKGLGRYFRHRSPRHIIGELEEAKKLFPRLRRIKFDDDTAFGFGKEWILEFAELYKKRIGLPFECLLHPSLIDEEILWILKDAGLVKVQVGIETTGAGRMIDLYGRAPAEEKIIRFDEINRRLKLAAVYDIILDDPSATDEDKESLFDFLMKLSGPFRLYLYSLVLFPGTVLSEELLKKGVVEPHQIEGRNMKALKQFRVSFDWPRPPADIFYMSLYTLVSKEFIPKELLRWLSRCEFLKRHPFFINMFARLANFIMMGRVALEMLFAKELTFFKLRQYGSIKKMISQ